MKKVNFSIIVFLVAILSFNGFCTVYIVPGTYSSIQSGINACFSGDTVLVEPGIYYENISMNGNNIVLCSRYLTTGNSGYISTTVIDGSSTGRVVTINQGEDSTCHVVGFTIQNGSSPSVPGQTYGGGGILILDSSPRIRNCIIQNNYAPGFGGGLCLTGSFSSAKVTDCTIRNNTAVSFGGGVCMGDCSPDAEIVNCIISGNTITCSCNWNGGGGGVNLYHTAKLVNCLVTGNSAPHSWVGGGGIHCDWGDYYGNQGIFVTGCTIANNTALNNGGVSYVITGGEFRNCILWGNTDSLGYVSNYEGNSFINCCTDPLPAGTGNISSDPGFINPAAVNFRLSGGSPCINAGDNALNNKAHDLDGNPRINAIIDMGAYEKRADSGFTVQIGSGTDTTEFFPIHSFYGYNYSQQIYLGSEISNGGGASGLITKLRFFYSGGSLNFGTWNAWTVYLGNTTKTEFMNDSAWVPVSAMTQVFSGLISDPVAGTWVEIILPVAFDYSGGNIVVAVDENSDNWDGPAQWASFYTGSPRGLLFYDDNINPDPASPPVANYGTDYSIAQVQFEMTNGYGSLEGYVKEEPGCSVPVAGAVITSGTNSTTANALGFYQLILPIGTYFDVTAHHGTVSQTISPVLITGGNTTTQDFCLQPYFPPPVNFMANLTGTLLNDVHLSWQSPGSIPDQWIHWDDGTNVGGLGYGGVAIFDVASRWPVEDIAPYNGTYLKKIRFVVTEVSATYTLKVWKGIDASILLLSQVVTNPYINAWNEVTLTTPVLIDGSEELWFGYEVNQTTGYPAGLASGPAIAGKGDMINAGYGWISMKNTWNYEFNWTLQGFVSANPMSAPQQVVPMVQTSTPPSVNTALAASLKPQILLYDPATSAKTPSQPAMTGQAMPVLGNPSPVLSSAVLTGYNVYRDNVKIGDSIPDLIYDDLLRPKGGYDYEVSAQYDLGESDRIGPLHVVVYTCFPPTGLAVSNSTLTTTAASLSWTPSTISVNPEWMLRWGVAGFQPGYGTTVNITATPGYSLSGLIPGTEYDFYIRTVCSPTDSSAWVKKTFRTRFINCPPGSVAEAEVCGTNTNGCDLLPPSFETIASGETKCGTSWLSRSHRDSDWYSFTLTEPSDVTLTGNADFTSFMGIGSAPCPSTVFYSSATNGPGYNTLITTRLDTSGTYYIYAAPAYAEQVVCDSLSRYWVKLSLNSCLSPIELNALSATSTSADLTWTSGGTLWNIEWGPFGFSLGAGTMISGTTSNPYHLSGLTTGNYYSYYVQSDCGGGSTSNWAGPFTFFLPCPPTTLPYTEDFTYQPVGNTPQCWQVSSPGAPSNWTTENQNYAGGVLPELVLHPYNPYFYNDRSYLTSPVINTTGTAELLLSFKQNIYAHTTNVIFEVWTTSDGGINWNSVWSISQLGGFGAETQNLSISNSDVGSATFQFAFAVNGNSWEIGDWEIDDISLTGVVQTGTLQGVVTVCSGTNTLEGVTVTAGTNSATTNVSGFYQLSDIPAGTYDIEFIKTGYVSKTVPGVEILMGMTTTLDTCLALAGPPVNFSVQNDTVHNGQTKCYDATQIITVAGSGTKFIVENGGSAMMIAGMKIRYLPGTLIHHGGYLLGKIAPAGPFCNIMPVPFVAAGTNGSDPELNGAQSMFTMYPNPTGGNFTIMQKEGKQPEKLTVEIFSMLGRKVLFEEFSGDRKFEVRFTGIPAGLYIVKVAAGGYSEMIKLVKSR